MKKVAIVTIPLPLNYGNALQTFALQRYLSCAHAVDVIDHLAQEDEGDVYLWHAFCAKSVAHAAIFILSCLTWTGRFCAYIRESRIRAWCARLIRKSTIRILHGKTDFKKENFPYDTVIVGSDQVWNSRARDVDFYMLEWVPDEVRRVSYAASFNAGAFPTDRAAFYREQMNRFSAVSVRESSGMKLLAVRLGVSSSLVCDPTLLLERAEWEREFNLNEEVAKDYYMCYLVSPRALEFCDDLIRIARYSKLPLRVYGYDCTTIPLRGNDIVGCIVKTIMLRWRLWRNGIRLHFAATPTEFLQGLKSCKGLFTDSFHGMMFATIFEKPCNVVVGVDESRVQMGAKIRDFAEMYGNKAVITKRFDLAALTRLKKTPRCRELIEFSKRWLSQAI